MGSGLPYEQMSRDLKLRTLSSEIMMKKNQEPRNPKILDFRVVNLPNCYKKRSKTKNKL